MQPRDEIVKYVFDKLSKDTLSQQEQSEILFVLKKFPQLEKIQQETNAIAEEIIQCCPEIKINLSNRRVIDTPQEITGNTFLICAAANNHQAVVTFLLMEAKASINIKNNFGSTALISAISNQRKEMIRYLLDAKADIHASDKIFDQAIIANNPDMVKLLLDAKVNLNSQNEDGETPLYIATKYQYYHFVTQLIDAKADVNIQNTHGYTPLYQAVMHCRRAIVSSLIKANANPDIRPGRTVDTALIVATRKNGQHVLEDYRAIAHELIVEAKADANICGIGLDTALTWAAYLGKREIAYDLIVYAKANLETSNSAGKTALDEAMRARQINVIALLLSSGAIISKPKELFERLQNADQRDPDVLIALNCLCKHLARELHSGKFGSESQLARIKPYIDKLNFFNQAQDHLEKLKTLTDLGRETFSTTLERTTKQALPRNLFNIIADYHGPLFFNSNVFLACQIDRQLPPKIEPPKKRNFF